MHDPKSHAAEETYLSQLEQQQTQVVIYLVNGFQIRGTIRQFDFNTLLVQDERRQQLVYKHAISTIAPVKSEGFTA